jgi:hypothetical protein
MSELVAEINKKKKFLKPELKNEFMSQVRTTLACDLTYAAKEAQLHKILNTIMDIARLNKFRRYE